MCRAICYFANMDARELLISPIAHMPPARVLEDLSSEESAARLSTASHSIVEIVAHMVYWQSWFLQRCKGAAIPPASTAALGWPSVDAGDWTAASEKFLTGLEQALEIALDASAAVRPIDPPIEFPPLANYKVSDAITHIAVHNAHHLGQIITLRQMMGAWPPPGGSYTW